MWSLQAHASGLPVALQAELIVKLAAYDKNLRARAGDVVRTMIVVRPGDVTSERYGAQLSAGLARADRIAGLPHTETVVPYRDAAAMATACKDARVASIVLAPELASEVDAVRLALTGISVLSIIPSMTAVRRGVVLGFELEEGKPKLFFNLAQAAAQRVVMSSDVLKLMTVFS